MTKGLRVIRYGWNAGGRAVSLKDFENSPSKYYYFIDKNVDRDVFKKNGEFCTTHAGHDVRLYGPLRTGNVNLYLSRSIDSSNATVTELRTDSNFNQIHWDEVYILARALEDGDNLAKDNDGKWYNTKYQVALWHIKANRGEEYNNNNYNDNTTDETKIPKLNGDSEIVYNQAKAFEIYKEAENNKEPTLKSINYDVKVEQDNFLIGPINIDYGMLTSSFGNQTLEVKKINLELKGKYSSGNTESENIANYSFLDKDETSLVNFPETGTNFYIKVPKTQGNKTLVSVDSLKVTIRALDAKASVYEVSGVQAYYNKWKLNGDYTTFSKTGTILNHEVQNLWLASAAELFWKKYELEIPFEQIPQVIDIGGKVWVDMPTGDKEFDENGIYDSLENGRRNVKVTLYFAANNQKVKTGANTVNGEEVLVESDEKNNLENGVYTTYTDANGNYMFYGLPAGYQYYVVFEYDGSEYEIVDYLAGGNTSDYLSAPNSYNNTSKVEAEIDREGFIDRFSKIKYKTLREIINGRTSGRNNNDDNLVYITGSERGYNRSRIITTDNNDDVYVTGDKKTGKAIAPHIMTARTAQNYPLDLDDLRDIEYLQHINLGLKIRPKADLALQTQLKAGAMTIKDKEKIVFYKTNATDDQLVIDGTNTQDEYIKQEIAASDYNWKAKYDEIYGDNGNITGFMIDKDKLNIYVLYRIVIQNQCEGENETGIINQLVDYYDNRLELVPKDDREKVKDLFKSAGLNVPNSISSTSSNTYNLSWIEGDTKLVTWTIQPSTGDYNTMLAENLDLQIEDDNTSAIYLVLKVKENEDVLYTGTEYDQENGVLDGIQNIAEITSYSIVDRDGNSVGKIDKDSAPGNATPGDKDTYEDDTDPAPMFRLEMNWKPREITGNVWDDLNENGILDENGNGIQNVTVKLIEYIVDESGEVKEVERPGIKINAEAKTIEVSRNSSIKTDADGNYTINVEGGNYSLKFIYGNTEMLYGDYANKKYNGQDYQATKYVALSSGNVSGGYDNTNAFATVSDFQNAEIENKLIVGSAARGLDLSQPGVQPDEETIRWGVNTANDVSSARDLADIRADIIRNTSEITYENGSKLIELSGNGAVSSEEVAQFLSGNDNTETNYTYMASVSDIITVAANDLVQLPKVINLGLKERPKVELELQKEVKRIVLKTSDGKTLINTSDTTKLSNLQKLGDLEHEIDTTFINMDTVVMDGATLDIDYEITVKTNGEEDKLDNYIYVDEDHYEIDGLEYERGMLMNQVRAEIFDYVNINLDFRKDDNTTVTWTTAYDEDTGTINLNNIPLSEAVKTALPKDQKLVSQVLQTTTRDLKVTSDKLVIPIHLGITLSENTTTSDLNDFDFSNCAEIVTVYSGAGRRQYETVPGNYVPYDENGEKDDDLTGRTTITQPLGEQRIYYVIAIVSATILIVGIILIKKRVLRK